MARLARALRHRNYRLFFFGQGISLVGTWLTRFATVWMVYRLTGSGLLLGLVAFFGQAPAAVLAPLAGVLVDRWDRRRVIVVTQIAAMLQSAALALFTFTGWMTPWHLMALGAVQAVINAFDMPARQSFLGQMIEDRADLPNAIALNSSMVNGARLLGPVIAAVLVDLWGEGWCFAIDAASYIAVIVSLMMLRVPRRAARRTGTHVGQELVAGLRYVMRGPLVRAVLLLLAVTSVLGGAYTTVLPLVAGSVLRGGPHTLGILMATAGCGALCAAFYLASRTSSVGLPRVLATATTVLGLALVLLWPVRSMAVAMPLVFTCGASWMICLAGTNTILQTVVDPDMLGRVMSLYGMAFFGGMPVGALIQGWLADALGPMPTFACCGAAVLVAAIVYTIALPRITAAQDVSDQSAKNSRSTAASAAG